MSIDEIAADRAVVIYWGFKNIRAGLVEGKYGEGAYAKQDTRFGAQKPLVDVQAARVGRGASVSGEAGRRSFILIK